MSNKKTDKRQQAIIDIINKMFEIAGHDVTFDDIKDRKDDWYCQWTMTIEESKEWYDWGVNYLKKKMKFNDYLAKSNMSMYLLNYGLKYEVKDNHTT
jgi:hypothetical protein